MIDHCLQMHCIIPNLSACSRAVMGTAKSGHHLQDDSSISDCTLTCYAPDLCKSTDTASCPHICSMMHCEVNKLFTLPNCFTSIAQMYIGPKIDVKYDSSKSAGINSLWYDYRTYCLSPTEASIPPKSYCPQYGQAVHT